MTNEGKDKKPKEESEKKEGEESMDKGKEDTKTTAPEMSETKDTSELPAKKSKRVNAKDRTPKPKSSSADPPPDTKSEPISTKISETPAENSSTDITNIKSAYRMEGSPSTNSSMNESSYTNNYKFDMSYYFCTKSEFQVMDIYKYDFFIAPEGEYVYMHRKDLYGGKQFKDRLDFWQNRIIYSVKLFLSWVKIRLKMPVKVTQERTGMMHWLESQWLAITEEEMHSKFTTNSYRQGTQWFIDWTKFYTAETLIKEPTIQLGNNAVLNVRTCDTKMQQGLYLPERIEYVHNCLINMQDLYAEYANYNLAKKYWVVTYNSKAITDIKQLGIRHQEINVPITRVMTIWNARLLDFRNQMHIKIKSITEDLLDLSAGMAAENVRTLTDNLGLVLTNVGKMNAVPSAIFSANASDIFKTLVSGCALSSMFRMVFDIGPYNSMDLSMIIKCMAYLLYTPQPLIDAGSVQNIKAYLWKNYLGVFTQKEGQRYERWDSNDPNSTVADVCISGVNMRGLQNVPLNRMRTNENSKDVDNPALNFTGNSSNWEQFASSPARGPIAEFFRYDFPQRDTTSGINVLYEGSERMFRFDLIINFVGAVNAFPVYHGAIRNTDKNTLVGFWKLLKNQYVCYGEMTKYMTIAVDVICDLGITDFRPSQVPEALEIDYIQLFAVTTKLNFFTADFKMPYHKIKLWSAAVKVELGVCLNLYRYFWSKERNYTKVLISRSEVATFLEPIMALFRPLFTTDLAIWVFENAPSYMKVEPVFPEPEVEAYDLLDFFSELPHAENLMRGEEVKCGYMNSITYNAISSLNIGAGLAYKILGSDMQDGVQLQTKTRRDFIMSTKDITQPLIIKSIDDDYPCFRTSLCWMGPEQTMAPDDRTIISEIREGNKVIDVPVYVKWASSSAYFNDPIQYRPPSVMPVSFINFNKVETDLGGVNVRDTVRFYNNGMEDMVFTKDSDIDKFFEVSRLK